MRCLSSDSVHDRIDSTARSYLLAHGADLAGAVADPVLTIDADEAMTRPGQPSQGRARAQTGRGSGIIDAGLYQRSVRGAPPSAGEQDERDKDRLRTLHPTTPESDREIGLRGVEMAEAFSGIWTHEYRSRITKGRSSGLFATEQHCPRGRFRSWDHLPRHHGRDAQVDALGDGRMKHTAALYRRPLASLRHRQGLACMTISRLTFPGVAP
jgi:hypothetical protein